MCTLCTQDLNQHSNAPLFLHTTFVHGCLPLLNSFNKIKLFLIGDVVVMAISCVWTVWKLVPYELNTRFFESTGINDSTLLHRDNDLPEKEHAD